MQIRDPRLMDPDLQRTTPLTRRIAQHPGSETAGRVSARWLHLISFQLERTPRHDEPGTERPDHAHRGEGPVRQTDADVLAAGSAARRARRATPGAPCQIAGRKPGAVSR